MKKIFAALFGVLAFAGATSASAQTMMGAMMAEQNLTVGSRGEAVVWLQTHLEEKGFLTLPNGTAKGHFGPITKAALRKYQASIGVHATGFYGPITRAAVKGHMAPGMQAGVMVGGALMTPDRDIVENAVNAKNVATVVAAVQAAGLVDTLKGAGPFTVFAPTNAAFDKLPAGTVATLLKPENKGQLTDILTYHVVAGRYTAADLTNGLVLKTVQGKTLKFTRDSNGALMINGTTMVETADIVSRNGITHVINAVLMPADAMHADAGVEVGGALMMASKDIVDNAVAANNVSTLVAAVQAAGLVDTLKGAGPFTVFAPDNAAFAKLPAGTVDTLVKPENKAKLTEILTYHVVAGRYTAADLFDGQKLTTVQGKQLTVKKDGAKVWINGQAMVTTPNVISRNGVTHVIDTVLMP